MLHEVLEWSGITDSSPSPDQNSGSPSGPKTWIDGTLGGAGHGCAIIQRLGEADTFVGVDRDPSALERAQSNIETIRPWKCKIKLIEGSYREIPDYVRSKEIEKADGILLDLGLSSDQLADGNRGFSFRVGGPLDLRFQPNEGTPASLLLEKADEKEIADIIYQFGEERFSRRIARAIVERRLTSPIKTAEELADLVHRAVPGKVHGRIDSATRTFQALRIAVNQELLHLEQAMKSLVDCLKPGGRLVVITFHSLEDRIVKHAFREHPNLEPLTKKPILPSELETDRNPRARSAKLRVAVRKDQ